MRPPTPASLRDRLRSQLADLKMPGALMTSCGRSTAASSLPARPSGGARRPDPAPQSAPAADGHAQRPAPRRQDPGRPRLHLKAQRQARLAGQPAHAQLP
jgi:hypothetical protein